MYQVNPQAVDERKCTFFFLMLLFNIIIGTYCCWHNPHHRYVVVMLQTTSQVCMATGTVYSIGIHSVADVVSIT